MVIGCVEYMNTHYMRLHAAVSVRMDHMWSAKDAAVCSLSLYVCGVIECLQLFDGLSVCVSCYSLHSICECSCDDHHRKYNIIAMFVAIKLVTEHVSLVYNNVTNL